MQGRRKRKQHTKYVTHLPPASMLVSALWVNEGETVSMEAPTLGLRPAAFRVHTPCKVYVGGTTELRDAVGTREQKRAPRGYFQGKKRPDQWFLPYVGTTVGGKAGGS